MPLTAKEMVKLLTSNGFQKVSQNGSHVKLWKPDNNLTVIVPLHCKDLGKGLEQKILKQAGLK